MTFYIQNTATGLVLEVKDARRTQSAEIVMSNYHGGLNQLWTYENSMIYSQLNRLVLFAKTTSPCDVITYPPQGLPNHLWYFDGDSTIRSGHGKVLHVKDGSQKPGAKVLTYLKHGGPNQKFRKVTVSMPGDAVAPAPAPAPIQAPVPVPAATNRWAHVTAPRVNQNISAGTPFFLQNPSTGLVLDVANSSLTHSTPVIMFTRHGSPNQLWTYKDHMIYSQLNGMVLTAIGSTGAVVTYPAQNSSNQKWFFDPDSTLRNGNGKVLDINEGSRASGAKLIVFAKHGRVNQKFLRVAVQGPDRFGQTGQFANVAASFTIGGNNYGFKF